MSTSSSDSEAGEQTKNVSSFMVKSKNVKDDTGQAFKRRLGDLIFNSIFEAGNLGYVEQIDQHEYDLMVRPDVTNPRHRLWFNFTVSNQRLGQCVVFTFVNFSETVKLFHEGLTPVVRSRQEPNWIRLDEEQVFYYKSPAHGWRYVLSIAFRFSSYENEHQFALFYPYSYSNLFHFITRWEVELKRIDAKANGILHAKGGRASRLTKTPDNVFKGACKVKLKPRPRSSLGFYHCKKDDMRNYEAGHQVTIKPLGTSTLSRNIYHLSISSDSEYRRSVVVLCRATRGNLDSAASFLCQGFMDFLMSRHVVANEVKASAGIHVIPMLDPDAICAGNSRSDIFGQLVTPIVCGLSGSRNIYSNLKKVCNLIERLCRHSRQVILIELAVNLRLVGARIIGTQFDDSIRMERHLNLPRMMSRFATGFQLENCEFVKSEENWIDCVRFPNIDQYRLELSPFASYKRTLLERAYVNYDQRDYIALGKALVYSLLDVNRLRHGNIDSLLGNAVLDFHMDADDIDDLVLSFSELKSLHQWTGSQP